MVKETHRDAVVVALRMVIVLVVAHNGRPANSLSRFKRNERQAVGV